MRCWTDAEDAIVISARLAGHTWADVTRLVPGRSEKGTKDRWARVSRARAAEQVALAASQTSPAANGGAPAPGQPGSPQSSPNSVTAQPPSLHVHHTAQYAAHEGSDVDFRESLIRLASTSSVADPAQLHAAAANDFAATPEIEFGSEDEVREFMNQTDAEFVAWKANYGEQTTTRAAFDPALVDPALVDPALIDSDNAASWPMSDPNISDPGLLLQARYHANSDEDFQIHPPFTEPELDSLMAFVRATGPQRFKEKGYWELLAGLFFQAHKPSQLRAAYEQRLADTRPALHFTKEWSPAEDFALFHMAQQNRAIAADGSINFTLIAVALGRSPASCQARCQIFEIGVNFGDEATSNSVSTANLKAFQDQLATSGETSEPPGSPMGSSERRDEAYSSGYTDSDSELPAEPFWNTVKPSHLGGRAPQQSHGTKPASSSEDRALESTRAETLTEHTEKHQEAFEPRTPKKRTGQN